MSIEGAPKENTKRTKIRDFVAGSVRSVELGPTDETLAESKELFELLHNKDLLQELSKKGRLPNPQFLLISEKRQDISSLEERVVLVIDNEGEEPVSKIEGRISPSVDVSELNILYGYAGREIAIKYFRTDLRNLYETDKIIDRDVFYTALAKRTMIYSEFAQSHGNAIDQVYDNLMKFLEIAGDTEGDKDSNG